MRFQSFVVLAEMRTGSNFLESNLNAIPGVTCHGEAFNPAFIGNSGREEMLGVTLAERSADPMRLIRAMRDKTAGLPGFRYFHDHDPRVFDVVMEDPACAKIILTRNALESYISWKIARESDQWRISDAKNLKTARPTFEAVEFRRRLDDLQAYQARVLARLQATGQTAFYLDYEDILDLDVINGIAAFLGVPGRLQSLVMTFKKQNPEPLREKVANPQAMERALAEMDWFSIQATPNFEPRRNAAVPQYVAVDRAGLLFLPIKGGPEARVTEWMAQYGGLLRDFDRQGLRKWKAGHPGQRSFTVLRHPLARAHAAWCDYLARENVADLRGYMKRIHRFDLPPKGEGFPSLEAHRAGFVVFLEFVKHLMDGRTDLKVPPQFASLSATLAGFAQVQAPDVLIREDRLEAGLRFVAEEAGLPFHPLPAAREEAPWPLAEVVDARVEAAAKDAYGRDYAAYGFGSWAAG